MSIQYFFSQIKNYWRQLIIIIFLSSILGFFLALVQTPKYASESRLLIINYDADITKSFQSSEALGSLLVKIIHSEKFFKEVISSEPKIDQTYFPTNNQRKLDKAWKETVEMSVINSSGILEVKVFHPSFVQAQLLNQGFNLSLINYTQKIYPRAKIEILDPPFLSERPVKPNLLVYTLIAGVLGLGIFIGSIYVKKQFFQTNHPLDSTRSS